MFCTKCGLELPDDSQFCRKCGFALAVAPSQPSPAPTTKIVTFVFAAFAVLSLVVCFAKGIVPIYLAEAAVWAGLAWFWDKKSPSSKPLTGAILTFALIVAVATARISLATLYLNYASFARGSGYANTVTDGQWRLFQERTVLGKQLLLEAARLKERDPYWYTSMQQVAQNEGWDKSQARELLDQAVAFEPSYYHYYRLYAAYLLPQWYGQPGDIPAFGEEVSSHVSEPDSSILYFQIVSSNRLLLPGGNAGGTAGILPKSSTGL